MIRWRWIGDSLDGKSTLVVHGELTEAVQATGKNWIGVGVGKYQCFLIHDLLGAWGWDFIDMAYTQGSQLEAMNAAECYDKPEEIEEIEVMP